jgi:transposase
MANTRGPYTPEFRSRMVELVRSGRSPDELAREFEPSALSIRSWVARANINEGKSPGLTSDERKELSELKRENKILREEREILKKAAAWFAQETGTRSYRRSDS